MKLKLYPPAPRASARPPLSARQEGGPEAQLMAGRRKLRKSQKIHQILSILSNKRELKFNPIRNYLLEIVMGIY
jgi:hypothetical protein